MVPSSDNKCVDIYIPGEYWTLQSVSTSIQAHYHPIHITNDFPATKEIVFCGPFLKSHVLHVSPMTVSEWMQVRLISIMKPNDADAKITCFAAEALCSAGGLILDVDSRRFTIILDWRYCLIGEMWEYKAPFRLDLNRAALVDLTISCLTSLKSSNAGDFMPPTNGWENYDGRYFHCDILEHAMGSIINGMTLSHLHLYLFGSIFLSFGDYMRNPNRFSTIMEITYIQISTYDSIGIGDARFSIALSACLADGNDTTGISR